jgi:hypothetical protein
VWTCSKCATRIDPAFDVCWRCGTSSDGVEDPDFVSADEAEPIDDPIVDHPALPDEFDDGDRFAADESEAPLNLVACFTPDTQSVAEAKFVADQLLAEGIPATVENTHSAKVGWCRVVVRADDLERARRWVEEYEERRRAKRSEQE